jgi:hypothetical protein
MNRKVSRSRPPSGADRNIQDIYRVVNELVDAVNSFERSPDQTKGKPGDVRVVKNDDGTNEIQARGDDGWYKVDLERK